MKKNRNPGFASSDKRGLDEFPGELNRGDNKFSLQDNRSLNDKTGDQEKHNYTSRSKPQQHHNHHRLLFTELLKTLKIILPLVIFISLLVGIGHYVYSCSHDLGLTRKPERYLKRPIVPEVRIEDIKSPQIEKFIKNIAEFTIWHLQLDQSKAQMVLTPGPLVIYPELAIKKIDPDYNPLKPIDARLRFDWRFPRYQKTSDIVGVQLSAPCPIFREPPEFAESDSGKLGPALELSQYSLGYILYEINPVNNFYDGKIIDIDVKRNYNILDIEIANSTLIEEVFQKHVISKVGSNNGKGYVFMGSCIFGVQIYFKDGFNQNVFTTDNSGGEFYEILFDIYVKFE